MKIWSLLLCALVAPLAVGCGPEQADEPALEVGSEDDDLTASGPNGWQHQAAFDLTCTSGVQNKISKASRRHFYSFAGQAGQTTTFTLSGSWPASFGARIYVTDGDGKVLAWGKAPGKNSVTAEVTFKATGKHFVYVSPMSYGLVQKSYGYELTAAGCGGCQSDADCAAGEACHQVVCKGLGCQPFSVCQPQPLCAEYTTTDGRFYAKNFAAGSLAEAQAWLVADPEVFESGWATGACVEQNAKACNPDDAPVCGTPIVTDATSTYASLCEFRKVVREAAGYEGESKGKFTAGACAPTFCATASVLWEGSESPVYYVQNVASEADAQAFYAGFPAGSVTGTLQGACDQGWMCPALYNPVCGVIRDNPPQTFSNSCAFSAAVRASAGGVLGEGSKGYIQSSGACESVCNYDDPSKHYVVQSAEQCKAVKFACPEGQSPFFDSCGCGCQ